MPAKKLAFIVVEHNFPDLEPLLKFLGTRGRVPLVVVKAATRCLQDAHLTDLAGHVSHANRGDDAQKVFCLAVDQAVREGAEACCILDHGGYFASCVLNASWDDALYERLQRVSLIMETTVNGEPLYQDAVQWFDKASRGEFSALHALHAGRPLETKVRTVARCGEKDPLHAEVGRRIAESTATLLRSYGKDLRKMPLGILGYGQLGEKLARCLGVSNVLVHDLSRDPAPATATEPAFASKVEVLKHACVLFCVTGQGGLEPADSEHLNDDTWIASCTSADDELPRFFNDVVGRSDYSRQAAAKTIRISVGGKSIYVLTGGNAVNLAVGPSDPAAVERLHKAVLQDVSQSLTRILEAPLRSQRGTPGPGSPFAQFPRGCL